MDPNFYIFSDTFSTFWRQIEFGSSVILTSAAPILSSSQRSSPPPQPREALQQRQRFPPENLEGRCGSRLKMTAAGREKVVAATAAAAAKATRRLHYRRRRISIRSGTSASFQAQTASASTTINLSGISPTIGGRFSRMGAQSWDWQRLACAISWGTDRKCKRERNWRRWKRNKWPC